MRVHRPTFILEPLDRRVLLSTTITFQEGVNGYAGTLDTNVRFDSPDLGFGSAGIITVDGDDNSTLQGAQPVQALIRFNSIFGASAGQIPIGATIRTATLSIQTASYSSARSSDTVSLHRMLGTWSESSTWNSLGDGISAGGDAASSADATAVPSVENTLVNFNVTAALQAWLSNPSSNFGWAFLPGGGNGWDWESSETATLARRPVLSVTYDDGGPVTNTPPQVSAGGDQTITLPSGASLNGTVTDDGVAGPLTTLWSKVSGPGTVTFGNANAIDTTASFSEDGTYVLRLTANDTEFTDSDDVQITVNPAGPSTTVTRTFRNGESSYAGTQDTHVRVDNPDASFGSATLVSVDGDDNGATGAQPVQGLLRFDSIFGAGAGQVPIGSTITSATLTLQTGSSTGAASTSTIALHRMLTSWGESSTWNSLSGGITTGTDALSSADGTTVPSTANALVNFNVTAALQAWLANPSSNFGWALLTGGFNGWEWDSSEATTISRRPMLSVTYSTGGPVANEPPTVNAGSNQTITLPDSASLNGTVTDDGVSGQLTTLWSKVSGPGTVTFGNANAIDTTASFSTSGTYVLRLTANDGEFTDTDDVQITVNPAPTSSPGIQALNNVQSTENTGEKPQSKVWKHADKWWAVFPNSTGTWVWRLDNTTWNPVFRINTRTTGKADVLPDGNVTHVLLYDGSGSTRLASIEYLSGSPGTYQAWSQRSTQPIISLSSGVEIATIAMDGNGRLWLASDGSSTIEVRYSDGNYSTWSSPITIASGVGTDDICDITTLPNGSVAVLWSNQNTERFGFRTHTAGASPSTWTADENPASQSALNVGNGFADDHMSLAVTSTGNVYAAVKTSYDTSGRAVIGLLVRRSNGNWDNFYTVDTDLSATRPIAVVNESQGIVMVVYRSGGDDIVYKTTSLTSPGSFSSRQVLIQGQANNVTSTRQVLGSDGVFLSASDSEVVKSARFVWGSSSSTLSLASSTTDSTLFADGTAIASSDDDDDLESLVLS